jgi:tripartite-type tricarboxylate transporter receptor subunit TctC
MTKKYLLALLIAFATSVAMPVFANEYKIFLNNPVGTGSDRVVRKISQLVKEQSGINLLVINQSAGNGLVAVTEFKKERLALLLAVTSQLAYLPLQLTEVPYQLTDFNIIAPLGNGGSVFFTRENSLIKNVEGLDKILPALSKGAFGVAAADSAANAKALVQMKNINVPVINFKNHNDVIINVIGEHVEVGVVPMSTTALWNSVDTKKVRILGVVSNKPFVKDGQTYPSINQTFDIPNFYSGAWLSITPGDTKEHQQLKSAVLMTLKNPELQTLIKESWPLGPISTLESIINTANKHKDLIK